jgi:hypothetical protein
VYCLTNDWSYFEQERTERTEAKAPFSLFSPAKHTITHLRDTTLALSPLSKNRQNNRVNLYHENESSSNENIHLRKYLMHCSLWFQGDKPRRPPPPPVANWQSEIH